MAEFEEVINLSVKTNGEKSVKSIKTEIREAKEEAIQMGRKFGEFSAQAIQAAKRLANLQDEMGDLNKRVAGLNPDRFAAIASVVQGLAGGIAAAQGAMALFGSESEDVNKALLKVNAALALSQGVNGILEMKNSLGGLVTKLVGPVVAAFESVAGAARLVGMALGVGIIITGVALVVSYWKEIKSFITGISSETSKLLAEQEELVKATKEKVDLEEKYAESVTDQKNLLIQQGYSLEEILRFEAARKRIALETNLEYLRQLQTQLALVKLSNSQKDERAQKVTNYLGAVVGSAFGLGKTDTEDLEKTLNEVNDKILKSKNDIAGIENEITGIHKKAQDDRTRDQQQYAQAQEEARKREEALAKQHADNLYGIENDLTKRLRKSKEDRAKSTTGKEIEIEDEKTRLAAEKQSQANQDHLSRQIEFFDESNKIHKEKADEELRIDQQKWAAKRAAEDSGYQATADVFTAIAGLAGEQSKIGKAAALASIAADTARALAAALANSQAPTPDNVVTGGIAGIAKYIALAATILGNAKRARDILNGGGAGASGGTPSFANQVPQNQYSFTQGSDQQGGKPIQVFVKEGDIRRSLMNVDRNKQVSVV